MVNNGCKRFFDKFQAVLEEIDYNTIFLENKIKLFIQFYVGLFIFKTT